MKKAIKTTSMNTIFAIFLNNLSKLVSKSFYQEYSLLIALYRRSLNSHGWQMIFYKEFQKDKENFMYLPHVKLPTEEFCSVNTGEFAPELANKFVSDFLVKNL